LKPKDIPPLLGPNLCMVESHRSKMAKSSREKAERLEPRASAEPEHRFEQLFERFVHPVNNFFSRRGFSREDCQDLTQETFLGASKGMERFRNESSEGTWLFKIAANVWRNELRRLSTEKRDAEEVSIDDAGDLPYRAEEEDPLAAMVTDERRQLLERALTELPDRMRSCLILRIYHDLKYREIATVMQISLNTVRSTISQATDRLQEKVAQFEEEERVVAREV